MLKKLTLVNLCKCSTNVYSPKKERENIRKYVVQAARIEYLTFVVALPIFFFCLAPPFFFLTFTLIKTKQKQARGKETAVCFYEGRRKQKKRYIYKDASKQERGMF